jgi:DeoR family transcriptional regulator, fructose operon transcriptional repressor
LRDWVNLCTVIRVIRAAERRQQILAAVRAGEGSVHELSSRFSVSPSTIRRDLERLGAQGHVARTYGGAVGGISPLERSLDEREQHRRAEKEAIAATAEAMVADGDVLILDAGSTIGRLAARLKHREGLTVITNGLNSLMTLADAAGVFVIVLGGELRALNQATLGPMAEAALRRIRANRAFISGSALHPEHGLAAPTLAHAHLKTVMIEHADEVVVLADHSKLGEAPAQFWTPLDRPWTLVTDAGAGARARSGFDALPEATIVVAGGHHEQEETPR